MESQIRRRRWPMFLVIAFLGTFGSGCIFDVDVIGEADVWVGESFSETVDAVGLERVVVRGVSGTVDVEGERSGSRVFIDGERRVGAGSRRDAERHLDDLEVDIFVEGRTLVVETVQPRVSYGRQYVVDYALSVPEDLEVRIQNTNGDVVAADLTNYVSVTLTNGPIYLYDVYADVEAVTTNGDIEADLTVPRDGFVDLRTTNGSIDLYVPRSTSADVSARVTNGRVTVSNLIFFDVEQTSRSLEARLGGGQGEIVLRTTNGSIRIVGTP